jgi:hypothetical protein
VLAHLPLKSRKRRILAEVANRHLRVVVRAAAPLTLQDDYCWRTDGNSPVISDQDGVVAFFSHYAPRGHTLRRVGTTDLCFREPARPVVILDDPQPWVGKWVEAVWREPSGRLRGWYHAEEPACGDRRLFVPHIGEMVSDDEGQHWHSCRELLKPGSFDCTWRNGFLAGGCGDLCVVPDRSAEWLYLFFTSYHVERRAQGIAVMRLPAATGMPELWSEHGWSRDMQQLPRPIWPARRGWQHANPDSFWGPAIHFNLALGRYVMLLNHTARGAGDLRQEGIYVSCNQTLADPTTWSLPLRLVEEGAWYPQVIGLQPGHGDTLAGPVARFFMAGFSMWELEFSAGREVGAARPLTPSAEEFASQYGPRRCPW